MADFLDEIEKMEQAEKAQTPPSPNQNTVATLSDEEKNAIVEIWNSGVTDLKDIIQKACGAGIDGRSKKGMAVKKFLAERNLSARPAHVYLRKGEAVFLTEDQKEFIANNAASMKPMEIAKLIFNKTELNGLSTEFNIVRRYYDELDLKVKAQTPDEEVSEYNPPRNESHAMARLNKYAFESFDKDKLSPKQKECIRRLIHFMHTHRFVFEMNMMQKMSERVLYESSFVRFVFDKPDLTEEEVDLYLNQCSDVVGVHRMQEELIKLTEARDVEMGDGGKIPMPLVEAIGKLRSNIDDNLKRQKATLNDLNGKRRDRLGEIAANNDSILKLVEAFQGEASRKRIVLLLQSEKEKVKKEGERLESIEDLRAQLFGASKEELT